MSSDVEKASGSRAQAILSGPGRDVVVLLRKDFPDGEPRLVAYASPDFGDREAMLESARSRMPSYMIPAAFVDVENWPRTSSGKIDRKQLQLPGELLKLDASIAVPAESDTQRAVVLVVAQVLNMDASRIGINHHILNDLGGTSLSAVRVANRLSEQYPTVPLGQADIFNNTIAKLSAHLDARIVADREVPCERVSQPDPTAGNQPSMAVLWLYGFLQALAALAIRVVGVASFFGYLALVGVLWGAFGPWCIGAAPFFQPLLHALSALQFILVKWLLVGRLRSGLHSRCSIAYIRWCTGRRIVRAASSSLQYFACTPMLNLILNGLGACVHAGAVVEDPTGVLDWDLVSIGPNTVIEHGAHVSAGEVRGGKLELKAVVSSSDGWPRKISTQTCQLTVHTTPIGKQHTGDVTYTESRIFCFRKAAYMRCAL